MSFDDEIVKLDATAQAELVRCRKITARELVTAAITRIEHLNPSINAVVTQRFDQALEEAEGELGEGSFAGVPFLLKNLVASCRGLRMTSGSRFLKNFVPRDDSELVQRYRAAGLIILGATNTPEFGCLPTTEPSLHGPTRNPWSPQHIPGGSSGGSAAAVAARLVPMAHGNDGGGSLRTPASCCNLFGLKPTRGRNPLGPDIGEFPGGLVAEHALTVSVRDSATLLDATAGPDLGAPYTVSPPKTSFSDEIRRRPGQLHVAVSTVAPTGAAVSSICKEATLSAARLCEELGHTVEEAAPQIDGDEIWKSFVVVWTSACALGIEAAIQLSGRRPRQAELEPFTWGLYELGQKWTAVEYLAALDRLQRLTRQVCKFLQFFDVWLTPTLATPPPKIGTFSFGAKDSLSFLQQIADFIPFPPIANACGLPAMSVPLNFSADGLPIGSHFLATYAEEAKLLRLAAQLEIARPWACRLPPIAESSIPISDKCGLT